MDSPRILLVVTGDLEKAALASALRSLFPTAHFEATKVQGFTSEKLPIPNEAIRGSRAETLVEDLLGAAVPKEPDGLPFDYAIAIEDVELENEDERHSDQGVHNILGHFRLAIDVVLEKKRTRAAPTVIPKGKARRYPLLDSDLLRRHFLQESCSFHLLRPMAEALFFGELPDAVSRAVGTGLPYPPIHFDPTICDIELFRVNDPKYLAATIDAETHLPKWATANRQRHPKHYLEYLLDPKGEKRRPYKEIEHGKSALAPLKWESVVSLPDHARMVRALLEDISDMVGVSLPWLDLAHCHPLTQRLPARSGLLRNLT